MFIGIQYFQYNTNTTTTTNDNDTKLVEMYTCNVKIMLRSDYIIFFVF